MIALACQESIARGTRVAECLDFAGRAAAEHPRVNFLLMTYYNIVFRRGEETFLDPYAAEDEPEFFAVASEAFFEAPQELARRHALLYGQLRAYYRLDPAAWG